MSAGQEMHESVVMVVPGDQLQGMHKTTHLEMLYIFCINYTRVIKVDA